jgi:Leucine-rich repeat (LRR) protein
MTDQDIIDELKKLCKFSYLMQLNHCVSISFHNPDDALGGTIRRSGHKAEIYRLVSRLKWLQAFDIRKCQMGDWPEMSARLLTHVDLSCNGLESVPKWVTEQRYLQNLNLGANNLKEVPDFSGIPLDVLKLHKNRLTKLSGVPKSLRRLNLFLNPMDEIPAELFELSLLEAFTFGVTKLKSLDSLACWRKLKWLTLAGNEINQLPDNICDLRQLELLQLAKNRLTKLPERIGEMNLRSLGLYHNQIENVPDSFYQLKLEQLNLAANPIKDKDRILSTFNGIKFLRTQ